MLLCSPFRGWQYASLASRVLSGRFSLIPHNLIGFFTVPSSVPPPPPLPSVPAAGLTSSSSSSSSSSSFSSAAADESSPSSGLEPLRDQSVQAGSAFGRRADSVEGVANIPQGQNRLPVQDGGLLGRRASHLVEASGDSDEPSPNFQELREQKHALLDRADKTLETIGQNRLLDRALNVLNKEVDAQGVDTDGLVIQVAIPPDFTPITVFPPEPGLAAEKLEMLREKAQASLSRYKQTHIAKVDKEKLENNLAECREGLMRIHTQCQQCLQGTEDTYDENHWWDWEQEFARLETRDVSFELKDEDGVVTLTTPSRESQTARAEEAGQQGNS